VGDATRQSPDALETLVLEQPLLHLLSLALEPASLGDLGLEGFDHRLQLDRPPRQRLASGLELLLMGEGIGECAADRSAELVDRDGDEEDGVEEVPHPRREPRIGGQRMGIHRELAGEVCRDRRGEQDRSRQEEPGDHDRKHQEDEVRAGDLDRAGWDRQPEGGDQQDHQEDRHEAELAATQDRDEADHQRRRDAVRHEAGGHSRARRSEEAAESCQRQAEGDHEEDHLKDPGLPPLDRIAAGHPPQPLPRASHAAILCARRPLGSAV
jgi:hypothetical protein